MIRTQDILPSYLTKTALLFEVSYMRAASIFLLSCLFVSHGFSQTSSDWRTKINSIELLVDDYHSVVKKLEAPAVLSTPKLSQYFHLKEGKVFAAFGSGECVETTYSYGRLLGWKVPKFTVILLVFTPAERVRPESLRFDFADFKIRSVEDLPGAYDMENEEEGITISTDRYGFVETVEFAPPKKFRDKQCQEQAREPLLPTILSNIRVFETKRE